MTLADTTRFALIALATMLCGSTSLSALASGQMTPQTHPPQSAPASPSGNAQVPSLPPTQPTGESATGQAHAAGPAAEHFDIEYVDGKITLDATNASLDKLLHEVASKAGIKISGGVSDERVFGHYGPASPEVVLAGLLDGTGANMLLVVGPKGGSELVLTQRIGGPTPPNALATALQTTTDDEGRPTSRYVAPGRSFQTPGPGGRGPFAPPPNFGPPTAQNAAAAGGDPAQQPADAGTTQQIYEQLQNAAQQKPQ